jgi:hypothetical protein
VTQQLDGRHATSGGPAEAQARRLPSWSPAVAEAAVYVVAVACVVWPAILHARHLILGASDDSRYYTWLGWRMGRLIAHGHVVPLRIPDVISPFGFDLRLIDGYLPSYVSGLYNLFAGPVLAFNFAMVTGAFLNVLGARALARRLTSRRLVQCAVTVAFLTAPPIGLSVQVGLLPLFWVFTVPLLVGDALDVASGARGIRPLRLTFLLVVAFLCSVYFLIFGGLAYGLIIAIAALRDRRYRMPVAALAAGGVAFVLLLPFVVPRIQLDRAEKQRGAKTELLVDSSLYSADALQLFAQPSRSTIRIPQPAAVKRALFRLPDPSRALESTVFPGLLLLAGLAAFVASPSRLRLPLGATTAVIWVFSLGPSLRVGGHVLWTSGGKPVSWLPFRLLQSVPGLGALRAPSRAGYVVVALLAAATAVALHHVLRDSRTSACVLAAGCAALISTNLLIPLPTATTNTTAASERALGQVARLARPGDTVLNVPADCDPALESYQMFHRTTVVGCAGSFAANPWRSKLVAYTNSAAFTKLRCDQTSYGRITTKARPLGDFGAGDVAALRRQFGVRFLLVDHHRTCASVDSALSFLRRYRSLGGDNRLEAIDLSRAAYPLAAR